MAPDFVERFKRYVNEDKREQELLKVTLEYY